MNLLELICSDGYIVVNKALIKEYGLNEALLLGVLASKQMYWKGRPDTETPDGFFYCTAKYIEEETTLSPHKQRNALANLEEMGIIETKLKGVPALKHFKILEDKLLKNLNPRCEKISQLDVEKFNGNNIKETILKNNNNICANDIENFFESLWKEYPKKKGKGSVSFTQKRKLYKLGQEQMLRAILRYKNEIKKNKTADKYVKNGSTFFNSGYVDYLDENYEGASEPKSYGVETI